MVQLQVDQLQYMIHLMHVYSLIYSVNVMYVAAYMTVNNSLLKHIYWWKENSHLDLYFYVYCPAINVFWLISTVIRYLIMIIISFNVIEATETFKIKVDDPKKPNIYIAILRFHNECYTDCFVCMTFKMISYIPYMVILIMILCYMIPLVLYVYTTSMG